jgi:hypothetical protein
VRRVAANPCKIARQSSTLCTSTASKLSFFQGLNPFGEEPELLIVAALIECIACSLEALLGLVLSENNEIRNRAWGPLPLDAIRSHDERLAAVDVLVLQPSAIGGVLHTDAICIIVHAQAETFALSLVFGSVFSSGQGNGRATYVTHLSDLCNTMTPPLTICRQRHGGEQPLVSAAGGFDHLWRLCFAGSPWRQRGFVNRSRRSDSASRLKCFD